MMNLDEIYSELKKLLGFGNLWVCVDDDKDIIHAHWFADKGWFIGHPICRKQVYERGENYIGWVANQMREEYRKKKIPA